MLTPIIISPPFGNWISVKGCTSVFGSFTADPRPGLWWQVLKTVRPTAGGWVNRIGLRNPGIRSVNVFDAQKMYSIAAHAKGDWGLLLDAIPEGMMIEINLSCPNTETYSISEEILRRFTRKHIVSCKLSPLADDSVIDLCVAANVHYLHLSNTLPVHRGGESGYAQQRVNLPLIEKTRKRYPALNIIGGGGIYRSTDMKRYADAGANLFSLATVWCNPLAGYLLIRGKR